MSSSHDRPNRILVVDDEPANVELIRRLLARSGYTHVESTTDPTEVESMYRALQPDLIMLDLHMPKLDGFGVMEQLSQLIRPGEFVPILVLTADVTQDSKQKALVSGAKDFLTKPFDPSEVVARVGNLLETRNYHLELRRHNELLEEKVQERTAALWETVGDLETARDDLRVAQEETIHSLSLAAEFRDDETSQHIERMSRYCSIIAAGMDFDNERCDTVRLASKMHDVGKIGVSDSILLKPGKLTDEEYLVMKEHAQIGYEILRGASSELARTAATIAWTHHEKVDGSGYPRGLTRDDIPLEGRIAAVADVFDALTTNRIYRRAFPLTEALDVMREGGGAHFDAEILDLFFDRMDEVLRMKAKLEGSSP
ncbi:MAG: response regulator [Actinobacteria bacterium]|nr:response regulator [Actinomycetota bacterium]